MTTIKIPAEIRYNEQGLIPAILQDETSRDVLMVAWMNQEALSITLETGFAHFWSRSRQALWKKGETSGNLMAVKQIWVDCDADVLLLMVEASGAACHTGAITCFYRRIEEMA